MTSLKDIMNIAVPKVPLELQEEVRNDESFAYTGCIDMIVALGMDADVISETKEIVNEETGETEEVVSYFCTADLTLSQKWLAALFTYKVYLERLKIEKSIEAINFKTLTFEIKGLDKIPENINDSLYWLNRTINAEIEKASGANAVLGVVTAYGGDSNG